MCIRDKIVTSRKVFKYILLAGCLLFPAIAKGYYIYDTTLAIQPNSPITTQDAVSAVLGGSFATSGFCGSINTCSNSVTITGYNIDINFYSTSPTGNVSQVLVPFFSTASIGHLSAGIYVANAYFYVDNSTLDVVGPPAANPVTKSFTVLAVPIPGTLWLLGAGLFSILILNKRPGLRNLASW